MDSINLVIPSTLCKYSTTIRKSCQRFNISSFRGTTKEVTNDLFFKIMEDFQHVGYTKEVIEFVAVIIPLIYLKGSLLPRSDEEGNELIEDFVTEENYNYLYGELHRLMGEYDEYLEVFDENMQYSETPVVHSIAEKVCDIYQDLKNFIASYRCGLNEVIGEALWQLNENFEHYWGKSCAEVLRAVHQVVFKVKEED